ncbi:LysR family transcriptional regulator substrate-binding protein [Clostridium sp. AM58-1XD]|uniref:LysR family transcriptional regulator substrate-binding protein n=1 Tax=Clostridium sp. AM58-1XD TaxID=2292307 RepID=UPI001FA8FD0D|nr:LysR family transcriptional regulator substrate-binding protein [Clostridium sp. AM58-1XD]
MDELRHGRLDVIFIPERALGPELGYEEIYEEEFLLVAGDGMIGKDRCLDGYSSVIDWKRVKDLPFAVLKKGHGSREKCEEIFRRYAVNPVIAFETSSNLTALRMAEAGFAVAMVPEMTVRLFQGARRFNTYSLDKVPITWKVLAVYRKEAYQNLAQKEFIKIAQRVFNNKGVI